MFLLSRGRSVAGLTSKSMDATAKFCIFVYAFSLCNAQLSSIARDMGQVIFAYPKNVNGERDLSECPENTACSILYRRFWLPPLVERHCRCKRPSECPSRWSDTNDNRTMGLSNRSQMKFCSNLKELPSCQDDTVAVTVDEEGLEHITSRPQNLRNKPYKVADSRTVTAKCNCAGPHHWKAGKQHGDYHCSQLSKCKPDELCGYVRTDLYTTHYICSCPEKHQCVSRNKTTTNQNLLFYTGPTYSAFCLRAIKKFSNL